MKLLSKIMRFCAAQKKHENQLDKKFRTASLFRAPVRFHSNLSTLLKTLISFHKYDFIVQNHAFLRRAKSMKITLEKKFRTASFFPCAYAFSFRSFNFVKNFDFI